MMIALYNFDIQSTRYTCLAQVIQHGACLGLGIAGLGTEDEEAFEDVKNVLYMDNAGGCPGLALLAAML